MNRLETVSSYLSSTEWLHWVPFLSIPSGIVHLICAIRDRNLPPKADQALSESNKEAVLSLAARKLDNWTHTSKGIAAIIPFFGNLVLFLNWMERKLALHNFSCFLDCSGESRFPSLHLSTPCLVEDKPFIMNLINRGDINYWHYGHLPISLKNDPEIICALFNKNPDHAYYLFQDVPEEMRSNPQVAAAAIQSPQLARQLNRSITKKKIPSES